MASSALIRSNLSRAIAHRPAARLALIQVRHSTIDSSNPPYVPGGPVYRGTVNDATSFPPPSRAHGSHHWAFERLLSAAIIPMTVAAYVTSGSSYPILDGIFGISLVIHTHIGFDSSLVDYVHKRKFPVIGPIATWTLRALTAGVLVGVYQFNTNDIGLTELIAKAWHA